MVHALDGGLAPSDLRSMVGGPARSGGRGKPAGDDRGLREVLRANERAGQDAIQEILGETTEGDQQDVIARLVGAGGAPRP